MKTLLPHYDEKWIPDGYVRIEGGEYNGLLCKTGFTLLSDKERKEICNGIGAATGLTSHFPDTIWGLDCKAAGDIHDYDYHVGGKSEDRYMADVVFWRNLYWLIENRGAYLLRCLRKRRADKYYIALRVGGDAHFNKGGNAAQGGD